jgi:hypothetical protein
VQRGSEAEAWLSRVQRGSEAEAWLSRVQRGSEAAAWLSRVQRGSVGCSVAQRLQRGSVGCSVAQKLQRGSEAAAWLSRVQPDSVGSPLACCMAGPSSNPGAGRFFLLSETSNEGSTIASWGAGSVTGYKNNDVGDRERTAFFQSTFDGCTLRLSCTSPSDSGGRRESISLHTRSPSKNHLGQYCSCQVRSLYNYT